MARVEVSTDKVLVATCCYFLFEELIPIRQKTWRVALKVCFNPIQITLGDICIVVGECCGVIGYPELTVVLWSRRPGDMNMRRLAPVTREEENRITKDQSVAWTHASAPACSCA